MKFSFLISVLGVQAIQISKNDVDHSSEFFYPYDNGLVGDNNYDLPSYERVVPEIFASDSGDIFMRSMIENYALEAKNKDGSPSGKFWIDKEGARAAAAEVLETHKGIKGDELHEYLETYFPKTWAHFDVNVSGTIEVAKMPSFMRFIASD